MTLEKIILFGILSLPVIIFSWRVLYRFRSHGFYRFFSWECIIWLFVSNYKYWFVDPLAINQIFSWILLVISAYLVIAGVILIKKLGKPEQKRTDNALYQFEKTTELIDTGIFRYIRHPLYSSLLFLTWGIYLKHPAAILLVAAVLSTIFLFLTAIYDEKECIEVFGTAYGEYMKRSKRFIPFII